MSDEEGQPFREQPFIASDPAQVNAARKKAAREWKFFCSVIGELMKHKEGRRWVWDFAGNINPYQNPINPDNTHMTYYNLGLQESGKRLMLGAAEFPDDYLKMVKEAKARR